MMRSLFSGVTGLRNHQTRMDVIGNNISNVNTVGFKRSSVTFSDLFSETVSPAAGATATTGGVNPKQIGLGMSVSSIKMNHGAGSAQYTGNFLDFCIEGDGFFITQTQDGPRFTRDGSFNMDNAGNLVTNGGDFVLGYKVVYDTATKGFIQDPAITNWTTADLNKIQIDYDKFTGFAVDKTGAVVAQTKQKSWVCKAAGPVTVGGVNYSSGDIVAQDITGQAGYNAADWDTLAEGAKMTLGYVCLGNFVNPAGLRKEGNNYYNVTVNSGDVELGRPNDPSFGKLSGSTLEMSNVDLAEEFVNMIVTQRGLQANSRIITTSDSILEELVNLKR